SFSAASSVLPRRDQSWAEVGRELASSVPVHDRRRNPGSPKEQKGRGFSSPEPSRSRRNSWKLTEERLRVWSRILPRLSLKVFRRVPLATACGPSVNRRGGKRRARLGEGRRAFRAGIAVRGTIRPAIRDEARRCLGRAR